MMAEGGGFISFDANHGFTMRDKARKMLWQSLKGIGVSIIIFVLVVIALGFAFAGWAYLEILGVIDKRRTLWK